jgi:serine/threonine protein kinase
MPSLIRRIGASKLATVSEFQIADGRHVACKQYDRQVLSDSLHSELFAAAARWKTLSSSLVVPYLSVKPSENQILLELLDRSVATRLREGPSDARLVLHTLRDILTGLSFLHQRGLLHGNLKPTNVFYDVDGRAKLSDGLLLSLKGAHSFPWISNRKYMAPEQARDPAQPMMASGDLYCAGLLALELLAADRFTRAFPEIHEQATDEDVAWQSWHATAAESPRADQFSSHCPRELADVIARLVAKSSQQRYASARDALNDLPLDVSLDPKQFLDANTSEQADSRGQVSDVLERPATGIVLAIASGPRAGEMLGTNDGELFIGYDHTCMLRFSPEQYPDVTTKVLLRRGQEGWYALRVSGDTAFVNQNKIESKCTLRSGDIIRLTAQGPDIQFTMQSGGVAVRSLVERFLAPPAQSTGQPLRPTSAETSRPLQPAGSLSSPSAPPESSPTSAPSFSPAPPAETLMPASLDAPAIQGASRFGISIGLLLAGIGLGLILLVMTIIWFTR